MTPRERAQKIWEETAFHESSDNISPTLTAIAREIEAAVEEEREVCAVIVETKLVLHGDQYGGYAAPSTDADELAAAVRARGRPS